MMKKVICFLVAMIMTVSLSMTAFASAGWNLDNYGWWYQNWDGSYPAGQWKQIDGYWYHFDESGYMQTGWLYDGGWYYLMPSGAVAVDCWIYDSGYWYYMGSLGTMLTGWLNYNNDWYYLEPSGAMVTGSKIIDGIKYDFGSDGVWIEGSGTYTGIVPPYELDNYYDFMRTMSNSEYLEAYYAALELVEPLVGMERSEQLIWIATFLRIIFESGMTYSMTAPHYNDPYGYLILGSASCAGCAKATGMCLNILGIKYEHVNEGQYSHQWCRVYVDGEYWICDAYGLYVGPEPAPYVHPYLS